MYKSVFRRNPKGMFTEFEGDGRFDFTTEKKTAVHITFNTSMNLNGTVFEKLIELNSMIDNILKAKEKEMQARLIPFERKK